MWCCAAGLTDPDVSKENNAFKIVGSVNHTVQQTTQKTKILNINNMETSNIFTLCYRNKVFYYISLYNKAEMKSAYLHFG